MDSQDELFQLIRSLSPSEKRYFKVNTTKGGDAKSNYVQLFDAMDRFEQYDEEKLKRKHRTSSFVKHLASEKKQLRMQILKHMRAFHSDRTIDTRINELLQDEALFRDKGLNSMRHETLLKAKELARKYERFHLLQEILEREIAYVEEFSDKKLTEPVLQLIREREELTVEQQVFLELWSLNKEIFSMYRSGVDHKDTEVMERMNSLLNQVDRHGPHLGASFRIDRTYHMAKSNYYNFVFDREQSYLHTEEEYRLFQEHSQFKEEYAINYKICLANLISRAQAARKE